MRSTNSLMSVGGFLSEEMKEKLKSVNGAWEYFLYFRRKLNQVFAACQVISSRLVERGGKSTKMKAAMGIDAILGQIPIFSALAQAAAVTGVIEYTGRMKQVQNFCNLVESGDAQDFAALVRDLAIELALQRADELGRLCGVGSDEVSPGQSLAQF